MKFFLLFHLFVAGVFCVDPFIEESELEAFSFLRILNEDSRVMMSELATLQYDYFTNVTEENKDNWFKAKAAAAKKVKEQNEVVKRFPWKYFRNQDIKRQFFKYSNIGIDILPEKRNQKYSKILATMMEVYSGAKICNLNNSRCDLPLTPDISDIMTLSRDEEELLHVWLEWRNAVGPKIRLLYKDFVTLVDESAQLNGHKDAAEEQMAMYETPDMMEQIENLLAQMRPLYMQLHAYVRYKLRMQYGDVVSEYGPIPAHLLGNMWAQQWNVFDFTKPCPGAKSTSITDAMVKQGYTPTKIFEVAEQFFQSINMSRMTDQFWKNSVLEKPTDRDVMCHASAFDMYKCDDFRIIQCTQVNEQHLITAHHEMGHIQYYMEYQDQPTAYRSGANDGFHEAIGDAIALSVNSLKHLNMLGLNDGEMNWQNELNNLYNSALQHIALIPFAFIMDKWRFQVYKGETKLDDYNCHWWKLAEEYQGIEPPVDREPTDFDVASKFHIVAHIAYMRYFLALIYQFQFHKTMCIEANEYSATEPLHRCDIGNHPEAGNALKKMLQLGTSVHWADALESFTGNRQMDASGILEYYKPLHEWLEQENQKNGVMVGWTKSNKQYCYDE